MLVACCGESPDGPSVSVLPDLDWSALTSAAVRHEVPALFYECLNSVSGVPVSALTTLESCFHATVRANLRLSSALIEIVSALRRAGIQAAPYKGPAVAWSLYEHPGLRQMDDIDILLRRPDIPRAVGILSDLGYRSQSTPDLRLLEGYRQVSLVNPAGIVVELHWALMPSGHPMSGDPAPYLGRLVSVTIAGTPVPCLAAQDYLPLLCLHAAKHMWESLKWVCDLARLVHSPAIDWPLAWQRAREERYTRALSIGLVLARDLLGTDLPPGAEPRDPRAERLAASIPWDRRPTPPEQKLFQLRCAETLTGKLALLRTFAQPTEADVTTPSPRVFHYPQRLLRLIRTYVLPAPSAPQQ
ncbi:MAG: nucleotidyltransferase family protein [Terriglobales bacterium]